MNESATRVKAFLQARAEKATHCPCNSALHRPTPAGPKAASQSERQKASERKSGPSKRLRCAFLLWRQASAKPTLARGEDVVASCNPNRICREKALGLTTSSPCQARKYSRRVVRRLVAQPCRVVERAEGTRLLVLLQGLVETKLLASASRTRAGTRGPVRGRRRCSQSLPRRERPVNST